MEKIITFWKKAWWSKLIIIVVGFILLSRVMITLSSQSQQSFKEGLDAGKKVALTLPTPSLATTTTLTVAPTLTATLLTPTKTPTPMLTISFNENRGNNYIAAKYAQQLMDMANGVKANMVLDAYMRLNPEEIGNQNEESYRNSVKTAVLAMKFDSSVWNIFDESTKRSLVTTYLKYPLGIFAANTVGLTIIDSNGAVIAKGTYDKREDRVNISVLN